MEKDIEILESFIKQLNDLPYTNIIDSVSLEKTLYEDICKAIENLINRVKELEEELEKEKRNNRWKENEQKELLKYKTIKIENSISKDKIKEKIKELEKLEKGFNFTGLITECETKIEVLQELLEE